MKAWLFKNIKSWLFVVGLFLLLYGVPCLQWWAIISGLVFWILASELPTMFKMWMIRKRAGRLLWK